MQNSADVAYKELYRYKVSHLKHGETVLKVGHPRGEKKQISLGMTTRKARAKAVCRRMGLDCLRASIGSMIRTRPAAMFLRVFMRVRDWMETKV